MCGPVWESCVQRILCPVKATSFQSSELTCESYLSLVQTRRSISFPPATDFPVAGLPAMGSIFFFQTQLPFCDRSRDSVRESPVPCCCAVFPSSLTRLYRIQHVTASIGSCGNHAIATQCLVKDVPPASGGIVHATCRFLQCSSNIWRMTCFWSQVTHDFTVHIKGLPLKKGCFEIGVKKIPTRVGCHLATHPKSWSCGRGIGLLVILLCVLQTSQYPSGLCPEEVALLVSLDGEHPSTGHIVVR